MDRGDSLLSMMSQETAADSEHSRSDASTVVEDGRVAATIFSIVGNQRAKFRNKTNSGAQDEIGQLEGLSAPIQVTRLNNSSSQSNIATFTLNRAVSSGGGPKSFSFPLAKQILERNRWLSFEEAMDLWDHAVYLHANLSLEEAARMYFTILRCTAKDLERVVPRKRLWTNKGLTHLYRGQTVEACFSFYRALLQHGYEPIILFLYATARFDLGHYHEANDAFKRCLPHFGNLSEIDLQNEGMQYTLSRTDVIFNEQLTARYKNALPVDPKKEALMRVPALVFFYPRPALPIETPLSSTWSPTSSEANEEKQTEKGKTKKAFQMSMMSPRTPRTPKMPKTPGISTPQSARSSKSDSKPSNTDTRPPWKKFAADLFFGKDDAPQDSFYGYSF